MNKDFLTEIGRKANCSGAAVDSIQSITMARQLWDIIPEPEHAFFFRIIKMCYDVCKPLFPKGDLEIFLIDEKGEIFR